MQAPTQRLSLESTPSDAEQSQSVLDLGASLQKVVRFDLKEEGNHVLAVSISYSETMISSREKASPPRNRTFRKLYQFVALPCLNIRTKISDYPFSTANKERWSLANWATFALEAQLENMADGPVTLERIVFKPHLDLKATAIKHEMKRGTSESSNKSPLLPREVTQVAFLVERQGQKQRLTNQLDQIDGDRIVLGQLEIIWRAVDGDQGFLSTGHLIAKKR
ncbi:MAG: hypothetical protein Q9167_001514 [Letrouitia subvulpina]